MRWLKDINWEKVKRKQYTMPIKLNLYENYIHSHQIYHSTHIVQLSSTFIVIVFVKRISRLKDLPSSLRTSISNHNDLPIFLHDSIALQKHLVTNIIVFARNKSIQSSFIHHHIKFSIFVLHISRIHDLPHHHWKLLLHLLNHRRRNINVNNILVASLPHLMRQLTITTPYHQYPISSFDIIF